MIRRTLRKPGVRILPIAVLISLAMPASVSARSPQDVRTLATKVADILAQFPAASSEQRDRLAAQMLALGDPGVAEFVRRLVPVGAGNDTAVRFAVNAMVVYASRFGGESDRAAAERGLVSALGTASDPEVRAFILSQLRPVGRDEAVRAAAQLLASPSGGTGPSLVEPSTQLMLAIHSASARQALVAALDKTAGADQVTVVKALGELRVDEANARLLALASAPGVPIRKSVLGALARIGNPASHRVLAGAARAADYRYEPTNATTALLEYAKRVGEKGDVAACEKICRELMKKCTDPERLPTSSAALAVLVDYRGHDVLPALIAAVDHRDRDYRHAALRLAEGLTGVAAIRQWSAKAQKVDPERRAEIIAMLGRQGDRRSLALIRSSLAATDSRVALAAAEALAHMIGAEANVDLLPMLKSRPAGDARRVADILQWTTDERHLDPLVATLDTLSPEAKAAAIGIIGAKGGRRFAPQVFAVAGDTNPEVRAAALGALAGVAGAGDVPQLLRLLESASEPAAIADVQRALVAAAAQVQPAQARSNPLLEAMTTSAHAERIIEVLPQTGGTGALAAVVGQFDRPEPAVKAAAFKALTDWKGIDAADRLFAICASADATYRGRAFAGFVRQISSSSLPADQKLLQLRRALPLASTLDERRAIVRAVERLKTFQAFLVAASFLDDAQLAADAAGAVMRIALPTAGARDGLTGTVVRSGLTKALQALAGPESEYDKENVRTYLAAMPAGEGFVPLFNGRDLSGWKGLVENPIARAKLTPEQLAAKQAEADARMRANWSVRDNAIVFNGSGDNLCTTRDYRDFEMIVDWRITKGGDSGIYLRGTPQVQIWDPARTDVGAEVGSGGLYNNQNNPSKPLVRADNPVGEWNTFRITMVGDKVTVFLNGLKVVDNVTLENYWDRKQGIFPSGAIELQAHGTDLAFRDIYVRELSEAEYRLTDEERADGFVALFNGRNLDGWIGNFGGYKVEDGAMVYDPKAGNRTNLYTASQYADFQFRFEFQLTPAANSGVGIRAPLEGDAAYVAMEIQVLDDGAPVYAALQPHQYHGSVYGVIPAQRGFLKPVGEWNSEEIVARGSRVRVTLNGHVIVDGDILEASRNGTLDHQQHPGLQRMQGHIGWLSHDSVVKFRNVRIKDLSGGKTD